MIVGLHLLGWLAYFLVTLLYSHVHFLEIHPNACWETEERQTYQPQYCELVSDVLTLDCDLHLLLYFVLGMHMRLGLKYDGRHLIKIAQI